MRILYLHQYFNTPSMSGGTRSYEMAVRMVRRGHEVVLVTSDQDPGPDERGTRVTIEDGIVVHWIPIPYSNRMGPARRVRSFLAYARRSIGVARKLEVDVVFATSTPLTIALPGVWTAFRKRCPLVFEVRDLWPDVPIALGYVSNRMLVWLLLRFELFVYRFSSHVITVAPGMKSDIRDKGIPEDKITVVSNGCDLALFHDGGAPVRGAAARDAQPPIPRRILYAGTVGAVNDVGYIVRLAAALPDPGPVPVVFDIVGEGRLKDAVVELARELNVLDRRVFFHAAVSKLEIAEWTMASDAAIITYSGPEMVFKDSVSNKFFDAISAGKPVLANYRGYATLLASEHAAGLILDRDPRVAAGELVAFLADGEGVKRAGANARRLAETRFGRDALADTFESVLIGAVRGARAPVAPPPGRAS